MDIKVINAGKCVVCGREIRIVAKRENNKFPNIFFCLECEYKVNEYKANKEKKKQEKEEE